MGVWIHHPKPEISYSRIGKMNRKTYRRKKKKKAVSGFTGAVVKLSGQSLEVGKNMYCNLNCADVYDNILCFRIFYKSILNTQAVPNYTAAH